MISSKKCENAAQFQVKNRQQNHYPNSIFITGKIGILSKIAYESYVFHKRLCTFRRLIIGPSDIILRNSNFLSSQ